MAKTARSTRRTYGKNSGSQGSQGLRKGLIKDTINRILRLANSKVTTAVLIACSSRMRIAEIIHLKLSDIDLTTSPTTILMRRYHKDPIAQNNQHYLRGD